MKVYIVFDHDDMVVYGVYDSEAKAVLVIEELIAGYRDKVDVSEKSELQTGGWYQIFFKEGDDSEVFYSLEEQEVQ